MNELNEHKWPDSDKAFDKIDFTPKAFQRIHWYYQHDLNRFREISVDPRKNAPYSGIIIPKQDVTITRGEIDIDKLNVIIDEYPILKERPIYIHTTLSNLLDEENLKKVFTK